MKFQKGNIPWNKERKMSDYPQCGFQKGHNINIGRERSKAYREKVSLIRKEKYKRLGYLNTPETRKKIGEASKKLWQNPEYFRKMCKALSVRPNKPETFLINFLNQILPNEYKYVGDGQFILGGKCPDFMNINGQKKLIELYGDYFHRNDNPQDRIDYFKEHGFDTLVIWQSELKDNNLKERIIEFNSI